MKAKVHTILGLIDLIEGSKTANIMLPKGTNVDTSQYIIIIFE
jgi:hypothetical protein